MLSRVTVSRQNYGRERGFVRARIPFLCTAAKTVGAFDKVEMRQKYQPSRGEYCISSLLAAGPMSTAIVASPDKMKSRLSGLYSPITIFDSLIENGAVFANSAARQRGVFIACD